MTNCTAFCLDIIAKNSMPEKFDVTEFVQNVCAKPSNDATDWFTTTCVFLVITKCLGYGEHLFCFLFVIQILANQHPFFKNIWNSLEVNIETMKIFSIITRFRDTWKKAQSGSKEESITSATSNVLSNATFVVGNNTAVESKELPKCILVFGRKGSGKSAFFKSIITEDIKKTSDFRFGLNSNVQGDRVMAIQCRNFSEQKQSKCCVSVEKIIDELNSEIGLLHAIVYCFSWEHGFSKEDTYAIQELKHKFGSTIVKKYFILVATDGTMLNFNEKQIVEFQKWLPQKANKRLKSLLKECQSRSVPFTRSNKIHHEHTHKMILKMTAQIIHRNASYNILHKDNVSDQGIQDEQTHDKKFELINGIKKMEEDATGISSSSTSDKRLVNEDGELMKTNDISLNKSPGINSSGSQRKSVVSSSKSSVVTLILGRKEKANIHAENSILFKEKHEISFGTSPAVASIFEGRHITIVNTQGLDSCYFNTDLNFCSLKTILGPVFKIQTEYDAIVYVVDSLAQNLEEESKAVSDLKLNMGRDVLKNHGILVLTKDEEIQNESVLNDPEYESFYAEFGDRKLLFDSQASNLETKACQVHDLLGIIDKQVSSNGKCKGSIVMNEDK